jgi:nucleoside-diphosphate-sugar epimerase
VATVLLTGAHGYLGSAVAAALDAARIDWAALRPRLEDIAPGSLRAQCVIHCAGALRHQGERLQRDNVQGTLRLLDGLRGGGARVLYASSRSVYGAAPGALCDETMAPSPNDDYGRSKWAAEEALRASGHAVLCCRLATLWGAAPRGDSPALPNLALRRWRDGEAMSLVAQDFEVDYLAVADAARALVLLASQPWPADATINLPGPRQRLHPLMAALARAARRHGLAATLRHDHTGGARWLLLQGERLRDCLPHFRHSDDEQVATAWLRQHAAAGPAPPAR